MSRQPVTNSDYISLSNKRFLDVQFGYSLPTNDDVSVENCIVVTFHSNIKHERIYDSVEFFENLTTDKLNSLSGDFAYISVDFDLDKVDLYLNKIKSIHSI